MKRAFSRISGIILLAVFAFFFASTNLFTHTHDGPDGKIVHSHPWSGKHHDHTSSQYQLINMLATCVFDVKPALDNIGAPHVCSIVLWLDNPDGWFASSFFDTTCLRGPPVFI